MDSNPDSDHLSHVDCDPDSNPDSGPGARVNAALARKLPLTSEGHSVAVVCWFESILALSERSKVHLARSQQTAALGHSPSLKMPQEVTVHS